MAKDLSAIVVMDVEATCWENDQDQTRTSSEIIEIGVCTLSLRPGIRVGEPESHLIAPQRSQVSEFCTRLTTITPAMLEGRPFYEEVVRQLIKSHKTQERIVATWGDYDRNMFRKHHDLWLAPYLIGPTHWNVKSMFAVARGLPREVAVPEALRLIGEPFEGTLHRGGDDAFNIAKILRHLIETWA